MFRRWAEQMRPICPMNLLTGSKSCYNQCLYCFKDGNDDKGDQLFGCRMSDELDLRLANHIEAQELKARPRGRPKKVGGE